MSDKKKVSNKVKEEAVNIKPVVLEELESDVEVDDTPANIDIIMSIPLDITVEIGKSRKQIKEIVEFKRGTIVELDKHAGDPVDLVVNGQLIAKGEVVVVNDNYGVRITDIISKEDIIKLSV